VNSVDGGVVERDSLTAPCVVLGAAVGVFGVAFGVGAVSAGATVTMTCVMSLLVFTGASQFSAVSVIAGGGTVVSALAGASLLAARNAVYGLTMSRRLRGSLPLRLIAAQLTIDESTAMATARSDEASVRRAFWLTGLSVYVFWNLGTLAGALIGTAIDPATVGLDAAFPAGFAAMVMPHLAHRSGRRAGLIGAAVCLVSIPFLPVGLPILCAAVGILVGVPKP
jgi:4-azaleucine resistance transporter AzlC